MSIDSKAAFGVLDLLYETLDDPGQWKVWLDRLCDLLRADGGNITVASRDDPERTLLIENCLTPNQLAAYVQEYAGKDWQRAQLEDEFTGRARALSQFSRSEIGEYLESDFFQEFAKDTPCWMSMGAVFLREDGLVGNSGLHRRDLEDPFSPEDIEFLEWLNPHIARVYEQAQYIHLLEDAIGQIGARGDAIFLIGPNVEVQYANDAASAIAHCGGLNVRDQQLVADTPADTERLQAAIAAAVGGRDGTFDLGTDLFISRSSNPMPLIVSVTPNYRRRPLYQAGSSPVHAVIVAIDPNRRPELRRRILRKLYGLTPREIQIGERLVTGKALPTIADELCISYHTVRTQVKRMIQKVGVKGQSQLMAFLSRLSN